MSIAPRQWLVELRGKRHQADIAKTVGISQQAFSTYETSERAPSVGVAKKIGKWWRQLGKVKVKQYSKKG